MTSDKAAKGGVFDHDRLARIGQRVKDDIAASRYHGAALRVAHRGEIVVDLVEGFADRAKGRPLSRQNTFHTQSVGKQFTVALTLSMIERGLLRLHTPVAELIPEFGTLGKERVNLFHLLTHTSGVESWTHVAPDVLMNIDRFVAYLSSRPLENLPGERVNYSALAAHSVIAAMCVRADGQRRSFSKMLEEDLFQPLGMHETSLGPRADLIERVCPLVPAYEKFSVFDAATVTATDSLLRMPGGELPGGGYITTITDLHRFAEMLRNGGQLDGVRILSPAMIEYASRNQTGEMRNVLFDSFESYRGWQHYPAYISAGFWVRGKSVIPGPLGILNSPQSFGGVGGGTTVFWVDPEREVSFALLTAGSMEPSDHFERAGTLSDMVIASMTR